MLKLFALFIQHGGTFDWSKVYSFAHRQRESCTTSVSVCSSHYIHSAAPSHQLWRAFTWVDRWLSWGSTAPNRGARTICQSPKTSSVMSSPPCQSWWHIKFVSGNSVGDYNLIQHCLEPMGRTRQLLWDIDDNVNVGRPHANNYKYDIFPRALTLGIIAWQYEGGVKTQEGTFLKRWV